LGFDVDEESLKGRGSVGFVAEREYPRIMRVVI
jgi:hypothetical protein